MNNYWELREVEEREALINSAINRVEKQLKYQYRRSAAKVEEKIYVVYDKILKEAGTDKALVSDLYKFNRYYELLKELNKELKKLGSKEKAIIDDELTQLYTNNFKLIGSQIGHSTNINQETVKKAVNTIWTADGKSWSSRVWTNKKQLIQTLTNGLIDCIATGASPQQLTEMIMSKMGVGYNAANRLAVTELSRVYNQAAIDKYKEADIKQVRYLTARDEKTCSTCGNLDNQVFPIDDAPTIPTHPFADALDLLYWIISS